MSAFMILFAELMSEKGYSDKSLKESDAPDFVTTYHKSVETIPGGLTTFSVKSTLQVHTFRTVLGYL